MSEKMDEWISFAQELADKSSKVILKYFGNRVEVHQKSDLTPVTIADREAEGIMREMIVNRFPAHQVKGEEGGISGPDSPYQWLLDPIDGTQSFIHGVPLFGTLIALLEEGRPIIGVINLPVSKEMLVGAEGRKTTLNGSPVQVSDTKDLSRATLLVTCTSILYQQGYGDAYPEIQDRVGLVRGWGDCYGHFMVATGRADIMFDPILNPWDIAALIPCIRGAGGKITDRDGKEPALGESALSSNGLLHDQMLDLLKGQLVTGPLNG